MALTGLLLTLVLMVTAWLVAKHNGYAADLSGPPSFKELWASFLESIWALALLALAPLSPSYLPWSASAMRPIAASAGPRSERASLGRRRSSSSRASA